MSFLTSIHLYLVRSDISEGEIADAIEAGLTPVIIRACVKGIEKEGKAEIKAFGKKKTLSLGKFSHDWRGMTSVAEGRNSGESIKPTQTRPPMSKHSSEPTSSSCIKRDQRCKRTIRSTRARDPITTLRKLCHSSSSSCRCNNVCRSGHNACL